MWFKQCDGVRSIFNCFDQLELALKIINCYCLLYFACNVQSMGEQKLISSTSHVDISSMEKSIDGKGNT